MGIEILEERKFGSRSTVSHCQDHHDYTGQEVFGSGHPCQSFGCCDHLLGACPMPGPDGWLHGCPLHNTNDHDVDNCLSGQWKDPMTCYKLLVTDCARLPQLFTRRIDILRMIVDRPSTGRRQTGLWMATCPCPRILRHHCTQTRDIKVSFRRDYSYSSITGVCIRRGMMSITS
jgi:hypothetical protein